jgi:hypothetical protein
MQKNIRAPFFLLKFTVDRASIKEMTLLFWGIVNCFCLYSNTTNSLRNESPAVFQDSRNPKSHLVFGKTFMRLAPY